MSTAARARSTSASRRRRGSARKPAAPPAPSTPTVSGDDPATAAQVEFTPWSAGGARLRVSGARAKRGFYAPRSVGAPSTTRQTEILNTAVIAAPTDAAGVAVGEDVLSRSVVAHDPFTAYQRSEISSANVVVIGSVGVGKSSLLKTVYVLRPLILRRRRVVVFDRKDQQGAGEYTKLANMFGSRPIRFSLEGDGTTLNLLDPVIARGSGIGGVMRLVRTITETTNDNRPLNEWQVEALRRALGATFAKHEGQRQATIADLAQLLPLVANERTDLSPVARERLHESGAEVKFMLSGLLEEYGGLFDGETSTGVQLADSKLTVFDISQLPPDSAATAMVVAAANMWLMGELRAQRGLFTNVLAEEGWDLVGGANGRLWRSNIKLARGLGISTVTAFHKLGDIPKSDPAYAIIQEAETAHLYAQRRAEDQVSAIEAFNLDPNCASTLEHLPRGQHLFKIGAKPAIQVRHIRSPLEIELTNTDEAMTEAGR